MSEGVHLTLVKDTISVLAIFHEGGLFCDLDYFWTGKDIPVPCSILVGAEPVKVTLCS